MTHPTSAPHSVADPGKPASTNRDITDRLLYPLLAKAVARIPSRIHPNVLTLAGLGCALLAAAVLGFSTAPASLPACAGLLLAWVVLDACDGIHARNTGQCSNFGSFLDHFGDALGMLMLQLALIHRFHIDSPLIFGALLLRQALTGWIYIIQVHAGKLHIPTLGWSSEINGYAALLVAAYYFPTFRLQFGPLPETGLVGMVLLAYYVAVPMALAETALMVLKTKRLPG